MVKILDYKCPEPKDKVIDTEAFAAAGVVFPDVHKNRQMMVNYAKLQKPENDNVYVDLPFCHTVEADALGGIVNYGDAVTGPRAKSFIYKNLTEVGEMEPIDFSKGRIREVLEAAKTLKSQGEFVILEMAGPFTIMNILVDPSLVFKGMRKDLEGMKRIFERFHFILLEYVKECISAGVDAISYADPTGGVNILGPKFTKMYMELFTYDFLKSCAALDGDMLFVLCPKTALSLIGTEKAKFVDIELPREMSYAETFVELKGKAKFLGHLCIGMNSRKLKSTKIIEWI